jgi:hypothetical protein
MRLMGLPPHFVGFVTQVKSTDGHGTTLQRRRITSLLSESLCIDSLIFFSVRMLFMCSPSVSASGPLVNAGPLPASQLNRFEKRPLIKRFPQISSGTQSHCLFFH